MATEIDSLQISISTVANDASKPIDRIASSLESLRNSARGGAGLGNWAKQLTSLRDAANSVSVDRIRNLAAAFTVLGSVPKPAGLSAAVRALNNIKSIDLSGLSTDALKQLADALNILGNVQKPTGLTSAVNSLKKLPDISASLAGMDMNAFADQIQRVTDALAPLADRMQQISFGFSSLPIRIKSFIQTSENSSKTNIRHAGTFKTLGDSIKKATKSFGFLGTGISSQIAKFGIIVAAFRRVSSFVGGWVSESNDYVENLNLFTVSMGEAAEEAMKYAETVKEAVGIDPSEWMRNQGLFKQITSGFGVAQQQANLMSKNLTQLGYDISSYYNITTEEAMQKLQSAISGELEPVRRLGYALDVATLQQVAYNHGITQSINSMNQAQKSQLRYVALLEQSGNVMGDMARTVTSPANAIRILKQEITQLSRSLGNMLMPFLSAVIPYVQAFVQVLTMGAQALAEFFGFELPKFDYSGLGVGGVTNDVEDLDDAVSGASGSVKDLKRQLIGIDELTILNAPDNGGGGGGTGVGGVGGDLGLELPEYDFLGELNESVSNKIKEQILSIVDDVKGAINQGDWEGAGKVLADALNKIIPDASFSESIGNNLGGILENGIEFALGFIRNLDIESVGVNLASFANGLFSSITPENIGALLASKIKMAIDLAYGFVTTFKWSEFGTWLSGVVNGWANEIDTVKLASTINTAVKGALSAASSFLQNTDFELIGRKIGQFLAELDWAGIFKEALTVAGDVFGALKDVFVGIFDEADFSDLLPVIGAILAVKLVPKLLSAILHPFDLMKKLAKMGGLSSSGEAASAVQSVTDSTSNVTTKLKDLATNLGWGLVILTEVAAAALIVTGAVILLGMELEQVGIAWEPVIENAGTVAIAMGIGVGLIAAIGAVAYGLGTIGKTAAVNIGIGTAILVEAGVATGLFIAEILGIGALLEQVGIAWEPVLNNGETIKTAIITGTGLLVGVGVVTGLLGAATTGTAGAIPIAIGVGTAMLVELGVATGLFLAEVWAVGKGLDEIGQAWQPVLDNGDTIKTGIETGTGLLVGVGIVAAALGVATVASVGLLPLAIAAGTALLVELSTATVAFTDSLVDVADEMTDRLAPSLSDFNTVLPGLSSDMQSFKDYMSDFAGFVVEYSKDTAVAAIASTVTTVVGWFTTDPIKSLTDDVNKIYGQVSGDEGLAAILSKTNPVLEPVSGDITSYADYMNQIADSITTYSGKQAVSSIATTIATIVGWFTDDPLSKFTGEVSKTWDVINGSDDTEGLDSLLTKTNPVLERVATNAGSYVESMGALSESISTYSGNQTVSAIGTAIETIKGWFTTDPLTKFKKEVDKTYKKIAGGEDEEGLDAALAKTYPVLSTASGNVNSYFENLNTFASSISTYSSESRASGISGSVDTISGWFVNDPFGTLATTVGENYDSLAGTNSTFGGHSAGLNEKLSDIIPELQTAYTSLSSYFGYLNLISDTTSGADFSGISDSIFVDMSGVGSNLVSGFAQGITDAGGVGAPVINGLNDMLTNINTYDWYTVGTNIGTGIVNGMYNIGQPLADWGQAVLDQVQAMFAIHSPSRLFRDEVGYFLGTGIGAGIDDSRPEILSTISSLSDDMQEQFAAASASMTAETVFPGFNADMIVDYERDSNTYAEFDTEDLAGVMQSNNEDIISVMYAVAQQVITAINEKDTSVRIDGDDITKRVTTLQEQYDRVYRR